MDLIKDLAHLVFGDRLPEMPSPHFTGPKQVEAFSRLGKLVTSIAEFGEAALIEDKGVYQQILELLTGATGKLSRLNWLFFEDGEGGEDDFIFRGQAAQAISSLKSQYYAFTVNGRTGQMVYKLSNPKEATEFGETEGAYEFAATAVKKKLNCKVGNIQCGGKCQNGKLNCYHGMTPDQKKAAKKAAKSARAVLALAPAPVPAAPPPPTPSPPPSYVKAAKLQEQRDELVKHLGEDKVAAAEASIKSSVDEAEVYIRVGGGNDTLEKILGDRFKSQFETGTSRGILSPDSRAGAEEWMFGYDKKNHAKDQRPLYGYLCRPSVVASGWRDEESEGVNTQGYGDIAIRLKSEVKNRATVTGDDSLGMDYLPSPVTNPSLVSFTRQGSIDELMQPAFAAGALSAIQAQTTGIDTSKNLLDIQKASWDSGMGSIYIEAQIHNQVRPSDIAEIIYMKGAPSPVVAAWAKTNNVLLSTGDEVKARAAAPDPSLDAIDSLMVA
jgi:hypothetical protein